jgi:replicative DNA helicase
MTEQQITRERRALGWALVDNAHIDDIPELTHEPHRLIRSTIFEIRDRGFPVDLVTVCGVLRDWGELDDVGGPAYVAMLVDDLGARPAPLRLVRGIE